MKERNQKILSISVILFLYFLNHLFISIAENLPILESFALYFNGIAIIAYLYVMAKVIIEN